ncbi:MAG TPA: MBL fold metallo-hydrolase [Thermoanaerobaculia bacterium]|nr:MBL fold metallo-hydrolase [Thermoanaerobaculia bacterium]
MGPIRLGELEVRLVQDGTFGLDGGAMFGVVPKTLWQKHKPADEQNRITMVTNCLLVARGGELALVDSGIGDKGDGKFRSIFRIAEDRVTLPEAIRGAGYEPGDVTHVVLSHLHFDHCGWSTREAGGRLVPTFPRARYWIERGELDHARHPNARDRPSYDPRNWEPLVEAGAVELFDDEAEPVAGVRAVKAPGHTRDMCVVLLDGAPEAADRSEGPCERAIFLADLVPTRAHVPTPWVMGYDLYPVTTMATKDHWLGRAHREGWLCIFEHEADRPLARLDEERPGRFRAEPIGGAADA